MKRIYVAEYRHGLKEPTKVIAESEGEAKKAAYAAYAFTTVNGYPAPEINDVVKGVFPLEDDTVMCGNGIQPCVQTESEPLTAKTALDRIFTRA